MSWAALNLHSTYWPICILRATTTLDFIQHQRFGFLVAIASLSPTSGSISRKHRGGEIEPKLFDTKFVCTVLDCASKYGSNCCHRSQVWCLARNLYFIWLDPPQSTLPRVPFTAPPPDQVKRRNCWSRSKRFAIPQNRFTQAFFRQTQIYLYLYNVQSVETNM